MIIVLALAAALLVGVGLVLQQHAAQRVPSAYFLRLRLIGALLRQRRWLAGLAIMTAGEIASAWVLGQLRLSVAEPLLATSLLFALVTAIPLTGERPRKSELLGAVLLAGGVAALSLSRSVPAVDVRFGSAAYWPCAGAIGLLALVLARAGRRRSGPVRAALTGTASGVIFGVSDALTRHTLQVVSAHGVAAVLTSWPAYALAVASVVAVWLMESAFNAAPLHASLPAITAAEPVVGIALGVLVFGDVIRVSPGTLALQAVGIAALVAGVILVARAPALSGLRRPLDAARPRMVVSPAGAAPGRAAGERAGSSGGAAGEHAGSGGGAPGRAGTGGAGSGRAGSGRAGLGCTGPGPTAPGPAAPELASTSPAVTPPDGVPRPGPPGGPSDLP